MKIDNPQTAVREKILPVLKDCFKDKLKSVILYGSGASGSFNSRYSDINILILLENCSSESIFQLGKKNGKLLRKFRITAQILSVEDFINSADVFPMEYNDIADRHLLIFGGDAVGNLEITRTNLRHQLEERLRGLSNQIRQTILNCRGSRRLLKAVISVMPGSVRTILRSALRLKGVSIKDVTDTMLISETEKNYGIDFSSFMNLSGVIADKDIFHVTSSLLDCIDRLTEKIDLMGKR
jgi:hypothetical protein